MDPPLSAELSLSCIPERIMGIRSIKAFEGVAVGARVSLVERERLKGPAGEGFIAIIVIWAFEAENIAKLSPSDQLIEEGLGTR